MRNETHRIEENRQDRCERSKHPDTFVDRLQSNFSATRPQTEERFLFVFFFFFLLFFTGREGPHTRCPRDVIMKLGQKQI